MLRRFSIAAICLGCCLPISTYAEEFSISDHTNPRRAPAPSLAPKPQFPSHSILDDLSVPSAPIPDSMPPAAPIFQSPIEEPTSGHYVSEPENLPPEFADSPGAIVDDSSSFPTEDAGVYYGDESYANESYGDGEIYGDDVYSDVCSGVDSGLGNQSGSQWCMDLWVAQGVTWNPDDPASGFNLPMTFNDQANDYQLNQVYLAVGRRVAESGPGFDLGGRVDLLYGSDYFFTQATGLETKANGDNRWNSSNGPRSANNASILGLAMPQAYVEAYLPVFGGLNIKAGHFYTTIGYESVMAPENFFYSHAYTMQYGEPFTHTGVMGSFNVGPSLSGHVGYTRGWDTWEDPNGKPGYLFGFSYAPNDYASLSATAHVGREDAAGNNQRQIISIVYTRQLNSRLRYVFQHDFGMESNAEFDENFQPDEAKWYGVNNYLFYDMSDKLTAGLRFEWFRDQDNARVLAIPQESLVEGGNYFQVTGGFNWSATNRLRFRPEVRWDWSDVVASGIAGGGMFNDFTEKNQITASMDMIYKF